MNDKPKPTPRSAAEFAAFLMGEPSPDVKDLVHEVAKATTMLDTAIGVYREVDTTEASKMTVDELKALASHVSELVRQAHDTLGAVNRLRAYRMLGGR